MCKHKSRQTGKIIKKVTNSKPETRNVKRDKIDPADTS